MKVIFTEDVPGVGQKHEVKKVRNGYAQNYLIPRKLVKLATVANLNWLKAQNVKKESKKNKAEIEAQNIATLIKKQSFVIKVRVGERGQLFASINQEKIASMLVEKGFKIKKSQIQLEKPIKELGKYEIVIMLTPTTKVNFTLQIESN